MPEGAGAYILLVALDGPLALDAATLAAAVLGPGRYAYCGSAYGPGGLAARLGRHLHRDKAVRWHIDRLTTAGRVVAVLALPGGRECDLFARVLACPGASVPVPGFGSSDCRRCPAHLAAVPEDFDAMAIASAVPAAGFDTP
ncbi:MAG: DUF123 domain-containing protein [Kiloniellaceae bacterium]